MASYFSDLPQELHVQILSNLDAVSLIRCAMTSKSIYDAFKSSSLLLYTIQLHLDGLKDSGTSIIYPELIESLVRRRQAWLSPERKDPAIHHTLRDCGAYELAGGAFANTNTTTDCLEVRWLPTSNGDLGCTLQTDAIGMSVRDLTIDPTQDLIILLDGNGMVSPSNHCIFRIHVHTISTNTIHPLAQKSPLQFTALPGYQYGTVIDTATLHVANKTLALYYRTNAQKPRILIWDWTTSELLLDGIEYSLRFIDYDFGLLDSTYFLLACSSDNGLIQLCKIGESSGHAIHLASLHLPPASPGTSARQIFCHTGPIEAHPLPHTSFMMQNDNDRLHSFTVLYDHRNVRRTDYLVSPLFLFVHQRVFAKYAQRALMGTDKMPLNVLWEEWGPRNTMFTRPRPEYTPNFIRHVHGQRSVFPSGIIGDGNLTSNPNAHCVDILDFSSAAVLSAKGVLDTPLMTPNPKGELVSSSIIRKMDVPFFVDDVETYLPCVITTLDLKRRHDPYMIHADGIIGVNVGSLA